MAVSGRVQKPVLITCTDCSLVVRGNEMYSNISEGDPWIPLEKNHLQHTLNTLTENSVTAQVIKSDW